MLMKFSEVCSAQRQADTTLNWAIAQKLWEDMIAFP